MIPASGGGTKIHRLLPGTWTPILLLLVVALTVVSFASQVTAARLGPDAPFVPSFVRWFYVDREGNIPTWFQGIVLFSCAQALWMIGHQAAEKRWRRHWVLLAAAFVYLSVDEVTEIHEQTITPLRMALGVGGFLFFAWILLAVPLLAAFALLFIGFLRHLPTRTRLWFLGAAGVYLGGAVGIEMIGAFLWSTTGTETLVYAATVGAEEAAEMAGLVLFLGVLMEYHGREETGGS